MEFAVMTAEGNKPKCPACGVVNEMYSAVMIKVLLDVHCVGLELAVSREELEARAANLGIEYDVGHVTCGACGASFRRKPWVLSKAQREDN